MQRLPRSPQNMTEAQLMADLIQLRRDTAANWTSANPTLSQGEQGYETDTGKMKIGDGSTAWTSLDYFVDPSSYATSSDITTAVAPKANTADLATVATTGAYSDLTGTPTGLATETYVDTAVSNLVDTAPDALNTLNELAAALNDDADFAGTVTTSLAAKANTADLATVATTGAYSDLTGTPTLATVATSGSYNDLTDQPVIAAAGGSFEAVASGSISDGAPVVLNADGTVAAVFQELSAPILHTLDNPNLYGTSTGDQFGYSVSTSDNYAIVGAYGEDEAGGDTSGKAYIFNVTTGALLHTLNNPNAYGTSGSDLFGFSVGISGNYAIVGAASEDDAGGTDSGKAYIFNVTTGALVHTLNNPNAYSTSANDLFGTSVGISGNYAIVGAYPEGDASGVYSGKAYIFNVTTGALVHTLNNPNPYGTSAYNYFGYSVRVSGNYAIVGAHQEGDAGGVNSGKAYIFDVTTGALVHTLDNPNAYGTSGSDLFGFSVGISGNYAIVGAYEEDDAGGTGSGKAYIFNVTTGALVHTLDNPTAYGTSVNDYFGSSVAISSNYAIVGAYFEGDAGGTRSGKAYIFDVTTGTLVHTYDNPNAYDTSANDYFGYSVSISDNYAIVGARQEGDASGTNSGKAYIYNTPTTITNLTAENYAGIADAAYGDAATATIQTAGSVDDAQSGLTPGQAYYVQGDGTLATTPDTPRVFAGVAASATKLLIGKEGPAADLSSYATETYVDTAVSNLVDTAPDALNTLNELAAALNDDADFAGTVTTSLAAKANTADLATVATSGSYNDLTDQPVIAAGGGGSFEAVASGSLSDGSTVIVNADGTVSIVAEEGTTAGFGSSVSHTSATGYTHTSTFDSNSNKVVVAYVDIATSYPAAVIGTVSGKSISFGTPVVFNSFDTTNISATFDSNSNKVVIAYRKSSTSRGEAIVGTVSGNSISFGSASIFETKFTYRIAATFDSSSNKVVIAYMSYEADGYTSYGRAIVGTVNGTSISFGSSSTFGNSLYGAIAVDHISPTFDSNSNKVVIAYQDKYSNTSYGAAVVGTVSGTSISFGSPVVFSSTTTDYISSVFDSNSNKVVIAYRTPSNANNGIGIVGTVSGTSISFGSPVLFANASIFYIFATFDSNSNKVVVIYRDSSNSGYGTSVVGTVSNTSISFTTPLVFENNTITAPQPAATFDSNSNKVVVSYVTGSHPNYTPNSIVYQVSDENISNLTAENYIGISDGSYSDGATATVQIVGSVDDAQSGLTPGKKYYVQTDGTLATTADDPSVFAGTAVSATKLIVKG